MNKKLKVIIMFMLLISSFTGCSQSNVVDYVAEENEPVKKTVIVTEKKEESIENNQKEISFDDYKLIEVDGGDLSGYREPNVVVDVGFGEREYWAFTNEYGQLVRVIAEEIVLQDDKTEDVLSTGRYFRDEAKVPGTESLDLDEGHVIADSLGGVSNAYNITPQDSTLNRHGEQAYMEKTIRQAGGCQDFEANIVYPNTSTQIPSSYNFVYYINGGKIVDSFENGNPEKANEEMGIYDNDTISNNTEDNISSIDTNHNGQVTIKEAKNAGYKMPIISDHWLYKYMHDGDGDGMVGE